jgi:hypothetical protein
VGGDLEGGGSSGGWLQGEGGGAAKGGEKGGLAAKKEKKGVTTRVLWEKETTPQMSPNFASNGQQPFPSSTHRRSTFGQHFFGILHVKTLFCLEACFIYVINYLFMLVIKMAF